MSGKSTWLPVTASDRSMILFDVTLKVPSVPSDPTSITAQAMDPAAVTDRSTATANSATAGTDLRC
jgi:hypothetical protein